MPRTRPVAPGMPLYCTKAPGQNKYLEPIFIFVTVGSNTSGIHDSDWGGVMVAVLRCKLSIAMPTMTGWPFHQYVVKGDRNLQPTENHNSGDFYRCEIKFIIAIPSQEIDGHRGHKL